MCVWEREREREREKEKEKVHNRCVVVLIEFIFFFNLKFQKYRRQKYRSILYHTWLKTYPHQIPLHRIVLYCIISYRIDDDDNEDDNDDEEEEKWIESQHTQTLNSNQPTTKNKKIKNIYRPLFLLFFSLLLTPYMNN